MVDLREQQRRERALRALSASSARPMTARQLIHRKVPWRTTMDLVADGIVEQAGPNRRAAMTYRLAS